MEKSIKSSGETVTDNKEKNKRRRKKTARHLKSKQKTKHQKCIHLQLES